MSFNDFLENLKLNLFEVNNEKMEESLRAKGERSLIDQKYKLEVEALIAVRRKEIEFKVAELDIQQKSKLEQSKEKWKREVDDYKIFLDELDALKAQMIASFNQCPTVSALLIHRHACKLLDKMWSEDSPLARQELEGKLIDLITAVQGDQSSLLPIPEAALALVRGTK